MPYKAKGQCVYKKDTGAKVGCTKGDVNDYLAALHMHANESIKEENKLVGGKADNLSLEDIAKKHKVSIDKIKEQVHKGIKVEMEHTNDTKKALEIVMDHLTEMSDYYDKLDKMENDNVDETDEKLIGGEADNMSAKDIAKKGGVSVDKIKNQIRKGTNSEKKEHGGNKGEGEEMAKDHLAKHPNYYNNLNKVEKAASKGEKVNEGSETTKSLIKRLIRENLNKK